VLSPRPFYQDQDQDPVVLDQDQDPIVQDQDQDLVVQDQDQDQVLHTESDICLFADDCILFSKVESSSDSSKRQEDIDKLYAWSVVW